MNRIIYDERPEDYYRRELDVVSNTGLVIVETRSLLHYKYWVEHPEYDRDTAAKRFGKAYHCAILEPDQFHKRYTVLDEDAPNRPSLRQRNAAKPSPATVKAIAYWDTLMASGKLVMPAEDYDTALRMAEVFRADPIAGQLLRGSRREVTLRWTEDIVLPDGSTYPLKHKARVDIDIEDIAWAADPKTTMNAHPESFARDVFTMRMHMQHAQYCAGYAACGRPLKDFVFLPQEKTPPYVVQPYRIDAAAEERGFVLRERAQKKVAGALATGRWTGYRDGISELILPAFAHYDLED